MKLTRQNNRLLLSKNRIGKGTNCSVTFKYWLSAKKCTARDFVPGIIYALFKLPDTTQFNI